jgi:hypothetical protein
LVARSGNAPARQPQLPRLAPSRGGAFLFEDQRRAELTNACSRCPSVATEKRVMILAIVASAILLVVIGGAIAFLASDLSIQG